MIESESNLESNGRATEKHGPGILPLIVVAIVIAAAVGGILLFNNQMKPDLVPGEVEVTISIDYGNGTVEWHNVSLANNSITGVLSCAVGSGNFKVNKSIEGVLYLESLKGIENNCTLGNISGTENMWWRYSINGTSAPSTNRTFESRNSLAPVRNGQVIAFSFMVSDGPSGIIDKSGISVTVKIDYGNGTSEQDVVITNNYTALGALEAMVGHENLTLADYGAWGFLVDGINGVKTGSPVEGISDTSNYYWLWYVNGDFAYVGASQYVLQDGDVMEWRFEKSIW